MGSYSIQCSANHPCYCNEKTCLYGSDNCNSGYVLWLGKPIRVNITRTPENRQSRIDEVDAICVNNLGHREAERQRRKEYQWNRDVIDKSTLVICCSNNEIVPHAIKYILGINS